MKAKTSKWIKLLVAAVITGGSNAGLAVLGIAGANAVGVNVPQLDLRQLLIAIASGAVVGLLAYLKQSPVPPDSGDTAFVSKDDSTLLIPPKELKP